MSSKTSILLSDANEHWYEDCNEDAIILEFNGEHKITNDGSSFEITIKKGTDLYRELRELILKVIPCRKSAQECIFSGDASRKLWVVINSINNKSTGDDIQNVLYLLCCKIQELETKLDNSK